MNREIIYLTLSLLMQNLSDTLKLIKKNTLKNSIEIIF